MPRLLLAALLPVALIQPAGTMGEFEVRLAPHELAHEQPTGVVSAANHVTTYQYDDGEFEGTTVIFFFEHELYETEGGRPAAWENEFSQRFNLSSPGTLSWLEVCLGNIGSSQRSFAFDVYVRREFTGLPGSVIDHAPNNSGTLVSRSSACYRVTGIDARVGAGAIWVSVEWKPDNDIVLMTDDSNRRGHRAYRARQTNEDSYSDWRQYDRFGGSFDHNYVYGIRLGVDHSTSTPPEPPTDSPLGPVTNLVLAPADRRITAGWRAPSTGAPAGGYEIFWSPYSSRSSAQLDTNITRYTIDGLINGVEYTVSVAARDSRGNRSSFRRATATPTRDIAIAGYDVYVSFWTDSDDSQTAESPAAIHESASTALGDRSAVYTFFDKNNPEVFVKVLDGCSINGYEWAFVATLTTLRYNVRIVRRSDGASQDYDGAARRGPWTHSDVAAFRCAR